MLKALAQKVWSYSIYSKTLTALSKTLTALQDAEGLEELQGEKEDYIYTLKKVSIWIQWIPSDKDYIIELYDEEVFCLNYEIEEDEENIVITINLRLNKYKIRKLIWFIAKNNNLDIEEVNEEIVEGKIYKILEVIAEAIKEWDKRYLEEIKKWYKIFN